MVLDDNEDLVMRPITTYIKYSVLFQTSMKA